MKRKHWDLWLRAGDGDGAALDEIFADFTATTDFPASTARAASILALLRLSRRRHHERCQIIEDGLRLSESGSLRRSTFYRELLQRNPDAKVILSVRDANSWVRSVQETIWSPYFFEKHWLFRAARRLERGGVVRRDAAAATRDAAATPPRHATPLRHATPPRRAGLLLGPRPQAFCKMYCRRAGTQGDEFWQRWTAGATLDPTR